MKKLIFLILLLMNLSICGLIEQMNTETQITTNRKKELKKAIKKRDLKTVITLIKNLIQTDGLISLFNDQKLLEIALKKFKNNKACMNDSGFLEDFLYTLIPTGFILPYAAFYYFYKNTPFPLLSPRVSLILKGTTIISAFLAFSASICCLKVYKSKTTACKESKLIYKILRKYSSFTEQLGEINA